MKKLMAVMIAGLFACASAYAGDKAPERAMLIPVGSSVSSVYAQDKAPEKDAQKVSAAEKKSEAKDDAKADKKSNKSTEKPKKEPSEAQKKQQERMKDCNAKAKEQNKSGPERKEFMSACLKG